MILDLHLQDSIAIVALESFQDRSFRFAVDVLRTYRAICSESDVPKHLSLQFLRSGTAVGANLAEAKSASSRRDLTAKNAIAIREARECHYWLRLIQIDQPAFASRLRPLIIEREALIAVLSRALRTLRGG